MNPRRIRWLTTVVITLAAAIIAYAHFPSLPRLSEDTRSDLIVVKKSERSLTLWLDGRPLKRYPIALGVAPRGPKEVQGDGRTPEGRYFIDGRNPGSRYHLALHISYPNAADRARAANMGRPPGGDIMVHGLPRGRGWLGRFGRWSDWTLGCICVTNADIAEIWGAVPVGTPIEILP
jgi:murein L,D-transpeptidase YafK